MDSVWEATKRDSVISSEHVVNHGATTSEKLMNSVSKIILTNKFANKGTAFDTKDRLRYGLTGLLPEKQETIENQTARCLMQCRNCPNDLFRYTYLLDLKERNETLFFRLLVENLVELLPFVYTPTVGEGCQKYSQLYTTPHGLYISLNNIGNVKTLIQNWTSTYTNDIAMVVISDGSRILGLGDLGVNGMGIPVGKGSLYVAAGGFEPSTIVPIIVDTGTNNAELLQDPLYLGIKEKRVEDDKFYKLFDEIIACIYEASPTCVVQFEDFSNDHCFELLDRYRNKFLTFNDDIQGTGAVVAAGFLNALKIADIEKPEELRVVFYGAGSAGVGVADQIARSLKFRYGHTDETWRKIFYMIDSKGLITSSRGGELAEYKKPYMRDDDKSCEKALKTLEEVIDTIKPHALIGLSGQAGMFTSTIIKKMAANNPRPIIFPLSNPTKNSECTAEDAYQYSNSKVIFASGSPFPPIIHTNPSTKKKETICPSQGNNMYVFPGIGFGAWLGKCTKISDEMLSHATVALADAVTEEDLQQGNLFPPLNNVRDVSAIIAGAVIDCAKDNKISSIDMGKINASKYAQINMWYPDYQPETPTISNL